LRGSSAAALGFGLGAGFLSQPQALAQSESIATKKIRLGLIGCGGRGSGAALNALKADPNTELWAVGDVFPEPIEQAVHSLEAQFKNSPGRVSLPKDRQFVGLDAYQKVLASGIDLVLLATPGGFRPMMLAAAIDAGKHVFCEKPMAVDPAGIRSVLESVKKAEERKLAIRAGFNMRFDAAYVEGMNRVHDGQIGEIVSIYASRMSGRLGRFSGERPAGQSDLEWQLRNWHHFCWLSGDLILEISVHSIDKIAWAMKDEPPVRCVATGAFHQQKIGDIWDQMDVTYEYANGTIAVLRSRYENNCHNEHRDVIIGTKGRLELGPGYNVAKITGAHPWRYAGPKPNSHQVEHDRLFEELRAGRIPNDGHRMASSTMMGIMGRMSAYTGKELTWDKAHASQLDTMPKDLRWDMTLPAPTPASPGSTPLV
jgi:predicted dehydrogenase